MQKWYFQVTTPELVQVKIYLNYSSGVFQVLLHLNFTWTSSYLNLAQVNLPELFLVFTSIEIELAFGTSSAFIFWFLMVTPSSVPVTVV